MKNPLHLCSLLGAAALAALSAGCVHTIGTPYTEPPEGLDHPYHVSEKAEILRVTVDVVAADADSAALAGSVREAAVTALRARKLNVGAEGASDLTLRLGVRDDLRDFKRVELRLDGTAERIAEGVTDAPERHRTGIDTQFVVHGFLLVVA